MITAIEEEHTKTAGLRERKKQQTRDAIHEAALSQIDEHGMERTTVDGICREADVSPRTFFNYFSSKADAALNLPGALVSGESAERFRAASGPLVPALCDLLAGSTEDGMRRDRVKEIVVRHPELMPALTNWMGGARGELIALVRERSSSDDAAELAVTLVLAAIGRVMHHLQEADDIPTAQRLRDTIEQFVGVANAELV